MEEKEKEALQLLKKAFSNMDQMRLTKNGMAITFVNPHEGASTFIDFGKAFDLIDENSGK